jgi:3-deoxy-manno-octulosonate cytidylyltransferase (CMP-KDO synthetase)
VAAVFRALGEDAWDLVVNLQGDEPFLPPEAMDRAVGRLLDDGEAEMATLAVPCSPGDLPRADVVKVVLDARGRALYFSRAGIPHGREGPAREALRHLGLYVFRPQALLRFVALPEGRLERIEGLEQLRALEAGFRIGVAVGEWPALGVDTPRDLEEAERRWRAVES